MYIVMHPLGRRRTVTDAEMEEFKKQVQCLGLPAPTVFSTETGTFSCIKHNVCKYEAQLWLSPPALIFDIEDAEIQSK